MSLLLLAAAAAMVAGAAGAVFARRRGDAKAGDPGNMAPAPPEPAPPPDPKLARLPLTLGDVVSVERDDPSTGAIGMRHEERWLSGGIVAREGNEIVGVLFVAPEGLRLGAVAVFSEPRREIAWMDPTPVEIGREAPTSLELGGVVMQRRVQRPVKLDRIGKDAPRAGDTGLWVEYAASGRAAAVVIRGERETFAWAGLLYDPGEYDRMGSGASS